MSARVSAGRGHSAPTPFTEETDVTGLAVLAPAGDLEPERADSLSGEVTWARVPFEVTTALFYSRVAHPLDVVETGDGLLPVRLMSAPGQTSARGTELI